MKQNSLILYGKEQLEWRTRELPALENDEVLIKTILGAISIGAELPQYMETDVTDRDPEYPKTTGYESYGEVIRVGPNVQSVQVGDRVVSFYGHKDVAIIKENNAIPVPKTISGSHALLTILSCDAAKGVFKVNPRRNDKALVTGMGPMGLLTVHFLKHYMKLNDIDIMEPDPHRREIAKILGANHRLETNADYDIGFECSGKSQAFQQLQKSMKQNGIICIISDGNKEELRLEPAFYEKELHITGSSDGWNYKKHARWFFQHVPKTLYIDKLFEYEIDQNTVIKCFDDLSKGTISPLKVLVRY